MFSGHPTPEGFNYYRNEYTMPFNPVGGVTINCWLIANYPQQLNLYLKPQEQNRLKIYD
jgi:hypothetical protein